MTINLPEDAIQSDPKRRKVNECVVLFEGAYTTADYEEKTTPNWSRIGSYKHFLCCLSIDHKIQMPIQTSNTKHSIYHSPGHETLKIHLFSRFIIARNDATVGLGGANTLQSGCRNTGTADVEVAQIRRCHLQVKQCAIGDIAIVPQQQHLQQRFSRPFFTADPNDVAGN